jgi:hypothetical protein
MWKKCPQGGPSRRDCRYATTRTGTREETTLRQSPRHASMEADRLRCRCPSEVSNRGSAYCPLFAAAILARAPSSLASLRSPPSHRFGVFVLWNGLLRGRGGQWRSRRNRGTGIELDCRTSLRRSQRKPRNRSCSPNRARFLRLIGKESWSGTARPQRKRKS